MVQKKVQELLAPAYSPTLGDYVAVVQAQSWGAFGRISSDSIQVVENAYPKYAAVYLAQECLEGRVPTGKGFREFVQQTFNERGTGTISEAIYAVYPEVYQRMRTEIEGAGPIEFVEVTEEQRRMREALGLGEPEGEELEEFRRGGRVRKRYEIPTVCLRPYMYPESAAEAALAMNLVSAEDKAPAYSRESYRKALERLAYSWFTSPKAQDKLFLPWLVGETG